MAPVKMQPNPSAEAPQPNRKRQPTRPGPSRLPRRRLCINLTNCGYDVIRHTCEEELGWRVIQNDEENVNCDIIWNDTHSNENLLARIKPYQRLNHFPGICNLGRKNFLAFHLNKMRQQFPADYNFFPETFCLPTEKNRVRKMVEEREPGTVFIVKPDASSEGRGIFLTKRIEDIPFTDNFIVQKYIKNPFLIDGLKFDLRVYVLIASVDPFRVFVYRNGIARFATEGYTAPSGASLNNVFKHLTNYAINKNSKNFQFDENPERADCGHKRSIGAVWERMKEEGLDTEKVWADVKDAVLKTICAIQPILKQVYRTSQPDDFTGGMCFQLLGFDVLLTDDLQPKVLEVNHAPSFNGDTPFDFKLKTELFADMFRLLQCNLETRNAIIEKSRQVFEEKFKNGVRTTLSLAEKDRLKQAWAAQQAPKVREAQGFFEQVFPVYKPGGDFQEDLERMAPYEAFMRYAEEQESKKHGLGEKRPPREPKVTQPIRSMSSLGRNRGKEKENEHVNRMISKLNQKARLDQIQETVNRLYSRKTEEIREAQEQVVIRQNQQLADWHLRAEKIKTNIVTLDFGSLRMF